MKTQENLTGGMANAIPPDLLPSGTAALIQNMRIREDGAWVAMPVPELMQEGLTTPLGPNTWDWHPANTPSDAIEDVVYVTADRHGNVALTYRKADGYFTTDPLQTGIDPDRIQVSKDSLQFVFVDGREGSPAHRIVIDSFGVISCRRFGTQQPTKPPTIRQIECAPFDDGAFTAMPVGSILLYAYCVVNEWGERSNPSPTIVCDTAQWLAKGEIDGKDYIYGDANRGSIRKVTLECEIKIPDVAVRIELYRTSAEYHESSTPMAAMQLVASQELDRTSATATITDTSFASPVAIDYDNDTAPAGDDIVLDMGTIFIANAVSDRTFIAPIEKVWAIRINNKNSINYVNRWITIDVRDDVAHAIPAMSTLDYFSGLASANELHTPGTNPLRFVDTDMITPLKAYCQGSAALTTIHPIHAPGTTPKAWMLTHIQIPYIPANSEKTIYLVQFSGSIDYGQNAIHVTNEEQAIEFRDAQLENPVRDENCLVAVGTIRNDTPVIGGHQWFNGNKANAYWSKKLQGDTIDAPSKHFPILIDDDIINAPLMSRTNAHGFLYSITGDTKGAAEYPRNDGIPAKETGYFYAFFTTPAVGTYKIAEIDTHEGTDGTITLQIVRTTDSGNKMQAIVTTTSPGDSETVELTLPDLGSGECRSFVFVSWRKSRDLYPAITQKTDITLATISHWSTNRAMTVAVDQQIGPLPEPLNPTLKIHGSGSPLFGVGYWYLTMGEYINDIREISAMSRFEPHYPGEALGYRGEFIQLPAGTGSHYCVNKNISIAPISTRNERRPGRIRWSSGSSMPKLFERNIADEIIRILPVKSFMPTQEHNTIMAWTRRGDLVRIALSGDNEESAAVVTDMVGTVLQSRHSIVQVTDGVVWADDKNIYLLAANGSRILSHRRIEVEQYKVIFNARDNEILFVTSTGKAMVYSIKWDTWSTVTLPIAPTGFIEFDGKWCITAETGVYELTPEEPLEKLPALIKTRLIPAAGTKINRIAVHGSDAAVSATIYNHRLPGGTAETPTFTLKDGSPTGIPGMSGDHVQLNITTDSIISYDIEVRDGNQIR